MQRAISPTIILSTPTPPIVSRMSRMSRNNAMANVIFKASCKTLPIIDLCPNLACQGKIRPQSRRWEEMEESEANNISSPKSTSSQSCLFCEEIGRICLMGPIGPIDGEESVSGGCGVRANVKRGIFGLFWPRVNWARISRGIMLRSHIFGPEHNRGIFRRTCRNCDLKFNGSESEHANWNV